MGKSSWHVVSVATFVAGLAFLSMLVATAQNSPLTAEDVMTGQELKATGLATATPAQRKAFNDWLIRYTASVVSLTEARAGKTAPRAAYRVTTSCSPAIESNIDGDFNGWEGETVFKLENGEIWEQAEYSYTYSYSYRPDVTIYQVSGGCRMKVEDEDETILVRRIK